VIDRLTAALADRYRVERELGAGGMATVYLAHDLRHERDVAIKVLHPDLGAALGGDRFLTEIRTTARLQHPHILPLLDSGDAGEGMLYYVMPFVRGETLRGRLSRERLLPVEDALRIAREVADALQHAHAQGIVHRDIKPENILLQDGHALVADFGIALAVQTAGTARMTQTGLSLGTPQYMAPEQAMGERSIDARADVYALGAVTYEMLTGDPPFTGSSVQAIVAKVLTERPTPIRATRDTVPLGVERAVLRAMAKLPADRFAGASEFAAALAAGLVGDSAAHRPVAAPARTRGRPLALVAGAAVLATAAFAGGRLLGSASDDPLGNIGRFTQVTWEPGLEITPALSPDGKQVVYAVSNGTRSRLYLRSVTGGRATPLTDDSTAVEAFPDWSSDGTRIRYLRIGAQGNQPYTVESTGGTGRPEMPPRAALTMAAWSPDGQRLAYVVVDSLFVRERDGMSRFVTTTKQPSLCHWGPRDLLLCSVGNLFYLFPGLAFGNVSPSSIAIIDLATGASHALTDDVFGNHSPQWSPDGRTVYFVSNRLGVPDLFSIGVTEKGEARGTPRRHTTGLGLWSFSLSADGRRIAFSGRNVSANVFRSPLAAPSGAEPARTQLTFGQQVIENLSVSADGGWLFYDSDLAGNSDIYRMRLPQSIPERLTSDPAPDFSPDPSPDGQSVAFHSPRGSSRDVLLLPLDGGALRKLTETPVDQELVPRWSPDGSRIVYFTLDPLESIRQLGAVRTAPRALPFRVAGSWPSWSPDGRFLAFATTILGGGLRVTPSDSAAPRALYDETAPGAPQAETSVWSADGRTIYFKTHDALGDAYVMAVPAAGGVPRRVMRLGDDRLRAGRFGFALKGGFIYYVLQDQQANVSVAEVGGGQ
jgi:serine/threonine protein kinase